MQPKNSNLKRRETIQPKNPILKPRKTIQPKNPSLELRKWNRTVVGDFLSTLHEPAVGVFDVGTRAARLLVAPRIVPDVWSQESFCTVSEPLSLGADVRIEDDILPLDSERLDFLIYWLHSQTRNLEKFGVDEVTVTGTAIFRWLANRDEVLDLIQRKTGFRVNVIPEFKEAEITLSSVPSILAKRSGGPPIENGDIVMTLDQGGGSLELAWSEWDEKSSSFGQMPDVRLFDELGTEALSQLFFRTSATDNYVKPEDNQANILSQMSRVQSHAERVISGWRGGPKSSKTRKIHAFALGNVIAQCHKGKNAYKRHNRPLTLNRIDQVSEAKRAKLEGEPGKRRQVRTLHKDMDALSKGSAKQMRERNKMVNDIAVLCGLPVFRRVMSKCGIDTLNTWGYGLRHGYYLEKYLDERVEATVEPNADGNFVFVSYSHKDKAIVYPQLERLAGSGCRLWYDEGIKPTSSWIQILTKKIEDAQAVLIFLTPSSVESDYVFREIALAFDLRKPIIPVMLRPAPLSSELKFFISTSQFILWSSVSGEKYFNQITSSIPRKCFIS